MNIRMLCEVFTGIATEVAIQLKTSLSFVLGLGALFASVKSFLIANIDLPDLSERQKVRRPHLSNLVDRARRAQWWRFFATASAFVVAVVCYVGWVAPLNVSQAGQVSEPLSAMEAFTVWVLIGCAVLILTLDVYGKIKRVELERALAESDRG